MNSNCIGEIFARSARQFGAFRPRQPFGTPYLGHLVHQFCRKAPGLRWMVLHEGNEPGAARRFQQAPGTNEADIFFDGRSFDIQGDK